jgi:hypothetical protein
MTIRKKMILILLASTTIPMFVVGVLGYFHARKTLESVRMEELKSIADLKVKRIERTPETHCHRTTATDAHEI